MQTQKMNQKILVHHIEDKSQDDHNSFQRYSLKKKNTLKAKFFLRTEINTVCSMATIINLPKMHFASFSFILGYQESLQKPKKTSHRTWPEEMMFSV